jgi:hypothetical protein
MTKWCFIGGFILSNITYTMTIVHSQASRYRDIFTLYIEYINMYIYSGGGVPHGYLRTVQSMTTTYGTRE